MRAGPSGEERFTPHYTVPVSPQCPQEISLITLPVFQGAAVSSERFSQSLPPRNVAELGGSPPLRGVPRAARSAVPCRSSVPGHRASRSKYTRDQSRETGSLSRLFGSVVLPNVSQWVTHTVEQGYVALCRSLSTGEQALVMEQEVSTLLREETIEVVPALDKESGFYSRTSLFRGKGLRPS